MLGDTGLSTSCFSSDCCDAPFPQPPLQLPSGCEHQGPDDPGPAQPRWLRSAQHGQRSLEAADQE